MGLESYCRMCKAMEATVLIHGSGKCAEKAYTALRCGSGANSGACYVVWIEARGEENLLLIAKLDDGH
jgi:hypothetical protein